MILPTTLCGGLGGRPTGSNNAADPYERYRLFDGLDESYDNGVEQEGVMTLEVGVINALP